MARGSNFYYAGDQGVGASIGESLGRALFGDPEAAAALQQAEDQRALRQAQARQADAHAGLFNSQTAGQNGQNTASNSLGGLIAALSNPPAPAPAIAAPDDPLAALPDVPVADPSAPLRSGLPAVIAALAQSRGENVDLGETIGALTSVLGDDEFARRGAIAQFGKTDKDFALTSGRADEIARQGYDADYRKDTAVASINHATDIPVANVKAGADRDVATINNRDNIDVANIKESGDYDRQGAIDLGSRFGTVTSSVRSAEHNRRVGGVSNSYHLASRGGRAIDIARKPGQSHAQIVAEYRRMGFKVIEALDEGDHTHLALSGGPGAAAKAKAEAKPAQISKADAEVINEEIKRQISAKGLNLLGDASTQITSNAYRRFQETGNPVEAVRQTVDLVSARIEARQAIAAGAPRAAVEADFTRQTGQRL
jgi:hypothetical protein